MGTSLAWSEGIAVIAEILKYAPAKSIAMRARFFNVALKWIAREAIICGLSANSMCCSVAGQRRPSSAGSIQLAPKQCLLTAGRYVNRPKRMWASDMVFVFTGGDLDQMPIFSGALCNDFAPHGTIRIQRPKSDRKQQSG
jgi:hypothetical protein